MVHVVDGIVWLSVSFAFDKQLGQLKQNLSFDLDLLLKAFNWFGITVPL